jgi:hypothetical protein
MPTRKSRGTATPPEKRAGIPKDAVYDPKDTQWELGKRDKRGNRIGTWRYWWPTTGHLCAESIFENGGRKETFTRYHPDGTWSQKGVMLDGELMPGTTLSMQRSKHKTTELALQVPEYKRVFRMEELYICKGLSLWKNWNRKGERIDLAGRRVLVQEKYAANFPGFELPSELDQLVDFQNVEGAECYAQGFALEVESKALPLYKLWSKKPEFLAKLMTLGGANGTGSDYCVWNDGSSNSLKELPIVIFGDEGGQHVIAENLSQLLQILGADVEPMVSLDAVSYVKAPGEDPSPSIDKFRMLLEVQFGITPSRKPETIVKRAQARLKAKFDAWISRYLSPPSGKRRA